VSAVCFFGAEFEVFGAFDAELFLGFAFLAFETQYDFACRFGLFVKDGFGLSTESHLFRIVPTLSLGKVRCLARLVLCHLVHHVLLASLTSTIRPTLLRNVHHTSIYI